MDAVDKKENNLIAKDNAKVDQENEHEPSEQTTPSSTSENSMIENITEGFSAELLPQLLELREKTKELTKNQTVLMETIQHENRKYSDNKEIEEFTKMISVTQLYYTKLKNIKTEMDQLDERMSKLKKRSFKLKERKKKQDLDEAQKKEHELALERELTAKPAT